MSVGRLEVITGGMYSGKSSELVRRLSRAQIAQKRVGAFKHASDDRYDAVNIGCHTGGTFGALPIRTVYELIAAIKGLEVIGIDEAQFFEPDLVTFCDKMATQGCRVIVAGLDMDSNGNPFGPVPQLMAVADEVVKLHAVCMVCGGEASRSYHFGRKTHQVEVGASQYEARCRGCALIPNE